MAAMRSFAVLPAAGASSRMGAQKLLLPWRGQTIIEHVLAAWSRSAVDRVIVVVRHADVELRRACEKFSVDVLPLGERPPDMKASARSALEHIRRAYAPEAHDAWLLAPADLPRLEAGAIDAVLAAYDPLQPTIVVPAFVGRRGHPTLFPWSLAERVDRLSAHEGLNALLPGARVREVPWSDESILRDVDTPADYANAVAGRSQEL
jgi:molybdenum cofactor cytidylyltransferase